LRERRGERGRKGRMERERRGGERGADEGERVREY
jgi:hypothetical protein